MKKMAIVSSYNELCGNATYTEVLKKEFSKYYDVDVLALRTDLLGSKYSKVVKLADKHIAELSKKLKEYDYVNIQFEAGLYGSYRKDIMRRIKILIKQCKNLTFTMHRLDIPESIFDKQSLKKIFSGNILKNLKEIRQNSYMAHLYPAIIKYLKKMSKKNNVNIVVHTKREKRNIQQLFGFNNVYDFPITFMNKNMRKREPDSDETTAFKSKFGYNRDDVIIGLFGFVSEYKAHDVVLRALKLLPSNYKVIIFGSQHPMSIIKNEKIDDYINKLISIIEDTDDESENENDFMEFIGKSLNKEKDKLRDRVVFAGSLNDKEFIDALYCCDFAILPYIETNQSGSGIASLVLESKIKAIYSNNKAFSELKKYYPDCFETFDIGNYMELAYKISHYNHDFRKQIDKCLEIYNLENNVLFQKRILEGEMRNGTVQAQL